MLDVGRGMLPPLLALIMTPANKFLHILSSKEVLKLQDNKKISRRAGGRDSHGAQNCVTVFSSMTAAMKAQSLLASNGLRSSVTKTNGSRSKSGCAFGISCACEEDERAMSILETYGLLTDVVRRAK